MSATSIPPLSFLRMQPLVFAGGQVYVPGSPAAAGLVTPSGARIDMRKLCAVQVVEEHCRRLQATGLAQIALGEARPRQSDPAGFLFEFLNIAAPAFQGWVDKGLTPDPRLDRGMRRANSVMLEQAVSRPSFPQSSLLIFGRFWTMEDSAGPCGRMHLQTADRKLALTGAYVSAYDLNQEWRRLALERLRAACSQFRELPDRASPNFQAEFERFRCCGFCERGDLVLFAGDPPLLGHILPVHFNSTLNAHCDRNLAICAPLPTSTQASTEKGLLAIFRRENSGWRRFQPPHGICLGAGPAVGDWDEISGPALNLAVFLRFAAIRLAANGAFHEKDG